MERSEQPLLAECAQHSAVVTDAFAETDRDTRTNGRDGFDDNAECWVNSHLQLTSSWRTP